MSGGFPFCDSLRVVVSALESRREEILSDVPIRLLSNSTLAGVDARLLDMLPLPERVLPLLIFAVLSRDGVLDNGVDMGEELGGCGIVDFCFCGSTGGWACGGGCGCCCGRNADAGPHARSTARIRNNTAFVAEETKPACNEILIHNCKSRKERGSGIALTRKKGRRDCSSIAG